MYLNTCASIIKGLFQNNGGWKRVQAELSVYYWSQIVGKEISENSETMFYRNGYLYVKTDNPALAQQIALMQNDILKRYQSKLGYNALKGIRVKIGSLSSKCNEPNKELDHNFQLTDQEKNIIEESQANIKDSELADKFTKAMHKAFQRKHQLNQEGWHKCGCCGVAIEARFKYCPCCERKLEEESLEYIEYLKKKNKDSNSMNLMKDVEHLFLEDYI
ncbi:MAG TPA: DUF721 domain-containing protein [Bacillota bacterium]|jgi:hypothetical protein|nr:DUF721 domain-containing protein [Bacillota bacterium]HOL10272.1 DUF721 domain-containing protein [Bacillota bacterium]